MCCKLGSSDCADKGGRGKHRCDFPTDYVFPDEQLVADSFGLKHNGDLCWDECNNQDGLLGRERADKNLSKRFVRNVSVYT